MKYFLDTEFSERPGTLELISIAIVCEDGTEFYAESSEFNRDLCNPWVQMHVLPKLGPVEGRLTNREIARGVLAFVGRDVPEFWGYYADYDWVVFCWLFGAMVDLPEGWPMYCRDLKQLSDHMGADPLQKPKGEHHALNDARWNKAMYQHLCNQAWASPQHWL